MPDQEYQVDSSLAIKLNGEMVLGICEFVTVYFRGAHTQLIREGVVAALTLYAEKYGRYLRFSTDFPRKRWVPFTVEAVATMAQQILSAAPDGSWQFRIHGGTMNEAPSFFRIEGLGFRDWQDEEGDYLSFLKMQLPPAWSQQHRDELPGFFQFLCERVRPVQGWGGLGFAVSEDMNKSRRMESVIYQIAQQFPTVEVEDPVFDQGELTKGIRGGNWLTAIGEPWLGKLGGIEELQRHLGAPFIITPYPNGATIKAGEGYGALDELLRALSPQQLTPAQKEQVVLPPHYRRLAQVLKPARIQAFPAIQSCQYGGPCFDEAATLAWLNRFD